MDTYSTVVNLQKATVYDIPAAMGILADGRRAQRAAGFRQWEDGYPPREAVEADVEAGRAYFLMMAGQAAGYACLMLDDPDYADVAHCFRLSGRFAVIHRVAMSHLFAGKGLARPFFTLLEQEARHLGAEVVRVDTAHENQTMQHLLTALGYDCLGHTDFCWGPRLTYEKSLAK